MAKTLLHTEEAQLCPQPRTSCLYRRQSSRLLCSSQQVGYHDASPLQPYVNRMRVRRPFPLSFGCGKIRAGGFAHEYGWAKMQQRHERGAWVDRLRKKQS